MARTLREVGYRTYWSTWGVLLLLTLAMLLTGTISLPKVVVVGFLLLAMLAKASLIGGNFMHLRFEKAALVLAVGLGILLTALALFGPIAFDGIRILRLSVH